MTDKNLIRDFHYDLICEGNLQGMSWSELQSLDDYYFEGDDRMRIYIHALDEFNFRRDMLVTYVNDYMRKWNYDRLRMQLLSGYTRDELRNDETLFTCVVIQRMEWNFLSKEYLKNIPLTLAYSWLLGERGYSISEMFDQAFGTNSDDWDDILDGDYTPDEMLDQLVEFGETFEFDSSLETIDIPRRVAFKPPELQLETLSVEEEIPSTSEDSVVEDEQAVPCEQAAIFSFLSFVAKYYTKGDQILCYGASNCPTVLELAFNLKIPLTCVDDYPMRRYPAFDYYSYEEFYFDLESTRCDYDGFFFCHAFADKTHRDSYRLACEILSRFSHVYYSIERDFTDDEPGGRVTGSCFIPTLYGHSNLFREEGFVMDDFYAYDTFDVEGTLGFMLRQSLDPPHRKSIGCSCFDCLTAARIIRDTVYLYPEPGDWIRYRLRPAFLCNSFRDYEMFVSLDEYVGSQFRNRDLLFNSDYVWKPGASQWFQYASKYKKSGFERRVSLRGDKDYGSLVVNKYEKPPVECVIAFHSEFHCMVSYHNENEGVKIKSSSRPVVLELPKVSIVSVVSDRAEYTVDGVEESIYFDFFDRQRIPCWNCESTVNVNCLTLNELISLFRPAAKMCEKCGFTTSFIYSSLV